MSNRPVFSSRLTALLTMAGLAIGLGNVWRFPYMMGQHGGSAFLLVYILFMLILGVPALMAEWSIGRASRTGPIGVYRQLFGKKLGLAVGIVLIFSVFMALSYYSLVIGNIVYSVWFSARHGFTAETQPLYQQGLHQSGLQYLMGFGVVAFSLWIVHRGLHRGIEVANRWMVPLFGIAALYLVMVALNLEGAWEKLTEFLRPDFSQLGPNVWFAAMGQVCFSVGLSGVLGVMYGSYLKQQQRLAPTALATSGMDMGAALLASLFVVPAVLVFGLDMAAGPGLLFNTLPQLFGVMPGGRWLASVFLLSWVMVALLTVIGTFDAVIGGMEDLGGFNLRRRHWIWTIGAVNLAVMLPIALNPHWIGVLDMVFGSGMFIFGALMAVLAAGWGLGKLGLQRQIGPGLSPPWRAVVTWWMRFAMPLALALILLNYIYSRINPA